MSDFRIVVDYDIFTYETSNAVFTTLFIDYHGKFFPDSQWNDFTDSVLSMWTYAVLKHRNLYEVKFELYFMDGPFRMDVFKNKDMQLTINCINGRGDNEILMYTIICNYYDFLIVLYDAIKSFNYILYSNGINTGRFESVYNQTIISMRELKEVIKNKEVTH